MPWENIGSCGSGQLPDDRDWMLHCYGMALSYLNFVMPPPKGCEFDIMWHEHELGEYPSLGLYWGAGHNDAPWDFISKCEKILERFDEAISWSDIDPDAIADILDYEEEEDDDDYEDEE